MLSYDESRLMLNIGRVCGYPYLLRKLKELKDELEVLDVKESGLASRATDDEFIPQTHKLPRGVDHIRFVDKRDKLESQIEALEEEIKAIDEWFERIGDEGAWIIKQHYWHKQGYREIGEALGINHQTAKNWADSFLQAI